MSVLDKENKSNFLDPWQFFGYVPYFRAPLVVSSTEPKKLRLSLHYRPRVAQWLERSLGMREAGFDPGPRHTNDVKNGRFALLSLALGINELGIRLGGSESV